MSSMTADLEYFKCDMCGVYMHRDIFCDHRRDCHGLGSTQLKRGECRQLADALGRDTREVLLGRRGLHTGTNVARAASSNDKRPLGECATAERGEDGAQPAAAAASPHVPAPSALSSSSSSPMLGAAAAAATSSPSAAALSAVVSTEARERRQEARTRRAVADRYQAALDAKVRALLTEDKRAALLQFLDA
ncbi:hypothetical protein NESM_000212400 [Novymonas esmeraldas]|uniref:C2H2-type domain-containing protein n=1 Tax=Novymonas esmeraldas TaxID=1808958 RepID=A0AAW0F4K3_9TRYP